MERWLEANNWDGRLLRSISFFLFKKEEITARLYANGSDPVERKTIKMQKRIAETTLPSRWEGMESRTVEEWPEMGMTTVNPSETREGRRQGEMLAGG